MNEPGIPNASRCVEHFYKKKSGSFAICHPVSWMANNSKLFGKSHILFLTRYPALKTNLQLNVERNPACFLFLICDWFRNIAPLSQPVRCKTKNHSRPGRPRFPALLVVWLVLLKLSLALKGIFLSSGRPLWLSRFWFCDPQSKCSLTF